MCLSPRLQVREEKMQGEEDGMEEFPREKVSVYI